MANKFAQALTESNAFSESEERIQRANAGTPDKLVPSSSSKPVTRPRKKDITKGVVINIPLKYYRRMRDYKDVTQGETLQSIALKAIIEWVEKNA